MIGSYPVTAAYNRGPLPTTATNITELRNPSHRVMITESRYVWWDSVVASLEKLVKLERGWDGYHGIPVSFENAEFALQILKTTCGFNASPPQIVPGASGDLQIEWHTERTDIELHVRAPNDVHAWRATTASGPDGEEIELTNDFTDIAKWVGELAESPSAVTTAAA